MQTAIAQPVIIAIGKRRYEVADIKAASALFCAARDKSGNGASRTPTPMLYRPDGEQFAYISYNGRVWAGSPRDWQPGKTPLCEAAA